MIRIEQRRIERARAEQTRLRDGHPDTRGIELAISDRTKDAEGKGRLLP